MSDFIMQHATVQSRVSGSSWVILSGIEASIKSKIETIGTPLKEWDIKINYGIKTGFNEAFIIDEDLRNNILKKCPKAAEIIRPILLGKNIKRYKYHWEGQWLINTHNGVKDNNLGPIDVQKDYPVIFDYLKGFLPKIKDRSDQGRHWTNLRNCAYLEEFEKPKIVWANLATSNQFSYISEPMIINNPSNFIATDNLYLLAVLNSKIADFYIKQLGVTRNGGYFEYKPMFVEQFPIVKVSKEKEDSLIKLVKEILDKKGDIQLERIVDEMVLDIYGLSQVEKKYVMNILTSTEVL